MPARWIVLLCCMLYSSGCQAPRMDSVDQSLSIYASKPFDVAPTPLADPTPNKLPAVPDAPATPKVSLISQSSDPAISGIQQASYTPNTTQTSQPSQTLRKFELHIPDSIPGAEAPLVKLPADKAERDKAVMNLFPELKALPEEPQPVPGPNGKPYTLSDLQQLAAANNPVLRQVASDVEAAKGNYQQASAYPNPTVGYEATPNGNLTSPGAQGVYVDQVIKTGGKLKLQAAAAQMDLKNAELAYKRARSDLATQVRTAYYAYLVAQETVRINRTLAKFTDEIFRLQAELLAAGQAASHEPAALRAQAFTIRLAYKQSIVNYAYAWKQLVATIGLPQLPLSTVEGRIDRAIPYYDYDKIKAIVLKQHTDVLVARNTREKSLFQLKSAQVTPVPDVEVRADLLHDFTLAPFNTFHTFSVSVPLPVWDLNKGNIRAATAGVVRASEEPHRVEVNLINGLASAYAAYQTNLDAVEYYRRDILPDQVRYYRGVFERRKIDPNASFGDIVNAQQNLTSTVTAYLGVLGQLWTSVVNVADYLQTDDLYQLGTPKDLPELPNFGSEPWSCPHPQPLPTASSTPCASCSTPLSATNTRTAVTASQPLVPIVSSTPPLAGTVTPAPVSVSPALPSARMDNSVPPSVAVPRQ